MAAGRHLGFHSTGNSAVRRSTRHPRKPHPRIKREVDRMRMTRYWDFSKMCEWALTNATIFSLKSIHISESYSKAIFYRTRCIPPLKLLTITVKRYKV